jgi:cytidine deaminase
VLCVTQISYLKGAIIETNLENLYTAISHFPVEAILKQNHIGAECISIFIFWQEKNW